MKEWNNALGKGERGRWLERLQNRMCTDIIQLY